MTLNLIFFLKYFCSRVFPLLNLMLGDFAIHCAFALMPFSLLKFFNHCCINYAYYLFSVWYNYNVSLCGLIDRSYLSCYTLGRHGFINCTCLDSNLRSCGSLKNTPILKICNILFQTSLLDKMVSMFVL